MLGLSGASRALGGLGWLLLLRSGTGVWLADAELTTTAATPGREHWGACTSTEGRLYFSSSLARLLRGVGVGVAPWFDSCSSSCLARIMGRRMRSLPARTTHTHTRCHQRHVRTANLNRHIIPHQQKLLYMLFHYRHFHQHKHILFHVRHCRLIPSQHTFLQQEHMYGSTTDIAISDPFNPMTTHISSTVTHILFRSRHCHRRFVQSHDNTHLSSAQKHTYIYTVPLHRRQPVHPMAIHILFD